MARAHKRVGMIVPSSNTTMETELPRIFAARAAAYPDESFSFHSSRMRMRTVNAEELLAMNAQTERCASELADARPDVVASACLVAIMAQGPGYHCEVETQIGSALDAEGAEGAVVTSAGALLEALGYMGAGRVAIITPYVPALTDLVAGYIADAGHEVHDAISLGVEDNRAVGSLDPAELVAHASRLDLAGCDAVVASACVQMPSLSAIEDVEATTGLPTLSAATATAWSVLRTLESAPEAPGAGRLLR